MPGAELLLSIGQGLANLGSSMATNNANAQLAQNANSWSIQQWNRENAYNKPSAQVQRLLNAGLNPALMYGNGIMNEAAQSPSVVTPEFRAPQLNFDPTVAAQVDVMNAQAEDFRASAKEKESRIPVNQQQVLNLQTAAKEAEQNIAVGVQRVQNLIAEKKLTEAKVEEIWANIFRNDEYLVLDKKKYNLDFNRYLLEKNLNETTISNLNADTRKKLAEAKVSEREFDEMCKTFAMRFLLLQNQSWHEGQEIEVARATARKLGIDADILEPAALRSKSITDSDVITKTVYFAIDYLLSKLSVSLPVK